MGLSRSFSGFVPRPNRLKIDGKSRLTRWAVDVASSGSSLHSEGAFTSGAIDLNARRLRPDGKVGLAHAATEFSRSLVHAGDQNFRTTGATDLLLDPLSPRGWVIHPDLCLAQAACDLPKGQRKHAVALWTGQRWRGHVGFNGEFVAHIHHRSLLYRTNSSGMKFHGNSSSIP